MEKTTIFSQVPRPPKRIWEDDTPVEAVIENPISSTENNEKFSTISVLKPKIKTLENVDEHEIITDIDSNINIEVAENKILEDDKMQMSTDVAETFTNVEMHDNKDVDNKIEHDFNPDIDAENNVVIQETVLGDKSDSDQDVERNATTATNSITTDNIDLIDVSENTIDFVEHDENVEFQPNETLESKIEATNDIEATADLEMPKIKDLEINTNQDIAFESEAVPALETLENTILADKDYVELASDTEVVINNIDVSENKDLENGLDWELDAHKNEADNITDETELKPFITAQKSINLSAQSQMEVKMPSDEELYKRQYYTMGEVATMFNANQSQIRFWENEFDILKPKKNKKGDRYFRPEDVKNLQLIHHLLRNKKFTIEGANEFLKNNKQRATDTVAAVESLQQLKLFLTELKANL